MTVLFLTDILALAVILQCAVILKSLCCVGPVLDLPADGGYWACEFRGDIRYGFVVI